MPGQYVRIGVDVDGVRCWRAYSLTHGPRPDGRISITVKAVPDGTVSPYLVRAHAARHPAPPRAGGRRVRPARPSARRGETKLPLRHRRLGHHPGDRDAAQPLPLHRQRRGPPGPLARRTTSPSLHVAPSEPDSIFLRDLKALDAAGAIRLVARYDDEHGILDLADLDALVPDLADRTTFACGPGGLLDAIETHHDERGLPLLTEQFRVATLVAGEGGTVTFEKSRHRGRVRRRPADPRAGRGGRRPDAERVPDGHLLPVRAADARRASVRDLRTGELTTAVPGETPTGGLKVQTCINAAAGPCHFDH